MHLFRNFALATAILAAVPGTAAAQENYLGLWAGYNLAQDSDWSTLTVTSTAKHNPGMTAAAILGRQMESGLRFEAELGYRVNTLDTLATTPVDGQVDKLTLMVNLIYEFNTGGEKIYGYSLGGGSPIRPYLGIGGGGALIHLNDVNTGGTPLTSDSEFGFAYQGIAGIGFEIAPDSILTFDLRYVGFPEIGFTAANGNSIDADFVDWTATIGLRAHF